MGSDGYSGEKIGRWMVYLAWVLLILLLTLLFSRWLDHQHNPNSASPGCFRRQWGWFTYITKKQHGALCRTGTHQWSAGCIFVGYGVTHVALPEFIAKKIGLERGILTTSMTANGLVKSWMTELDNVQLGPLSMSGVRAAIIPAMPGSEVLLGMSFLKHLELLQKGDQLILKAPEKK